MSGQIRLSAKTGLFIILAILSSGASWQVHKALARSSAAERRAQPAGPDSVLEPAADTYVSAFQQNSNFGSDDAMRIYQNYSKVLLRFDLSPLPPRCAITSAKLSVTFRSVTSDAPFNIKKFFVYDFATDFVENQATYAQAAKGQPWATAGLAEYQDFRVLPYKSPLLVAEPGEYSLDVTVMPQSRGPWDKLQLAWDAIGKACGQAESLSNPGAQPMSPETEVLPSQALGYGCSPAARGG